MPRIVVYALAVLHLGPRGAFALLAFGCDVPHPLVGSMCSGRSMRFYVIVTRCSWVVLGAESAPRIRRQSAWSGAVT
jgi:hypothetical protein